MYKQGQEPRRAPGWTSRNPKHTPVRTKGRRPCLGTIFAMRLFKKAKNKMSKEKNIKVEGETPETSHNEAEDVRVAEGAQDGAQAEQAEEAETAEKANEPELTPEEKAKAEAVEWKDKYIRLFAEFDNYKKRTMKEKAELILNGGEKTITALLPVLDDFERALADKGEDATAVREGFQLIMKKLEKILEGLGVRPIDTKDKDFDVDFHEAIAMVPAGDDQKGKVIDCVQTGYTLNDKVIRHAKVAVGQ